MFVRADIILTPNVLTFASPGDTFEVPVSVLNNIEGKDSSAIKLNMSSSDHFNFKSKSSEEFELAHRSDTTQTYSLEAKKKLGNAWLDFSASSGGILNSLKETLSIRPSSPFYSIYKMGSIKDDDISLDVGREVYSEKARRSLVIGATPLIFNKSLEAFLSNIPYGCTEQILSKATPHLILGSKNNLGYNKNTSAKFIEETIGQVRARQGSDGKISVYPGSYGERPYINLYSFHFLLVAKEKGYPIDNRMLRTTASYIKSKFKNSLSLYEKAYAVYLLSLAEEVTTPFLMQLDAELNARLEDLSSGKRKLWGSDLIVGYIAASYKMLQDHKKADELIDAVKFSEKEASTTSPYYSSYLRDARLVDIIARHFPERAKKISSDLLVSLFRDLDKNLNSLNASYTMFALDSYEKHFKAMAKKPFEIWKYQKKEGETDLVKEKVSLSEITENEFKFDEHTKKIEVVNKNDAFIFYSLVYGGFDKEKPIPRKMG